MYSIEKNLQIVLSLLKKHNIKKCVVSPGACNATFVYSLQADSYFEVFSSVDERSAAYLACGIASETGEAVLLSCTGATASRNYMSGLTEAYYRKLPILCITSLESQRSVGHLKTQQIDRSVVPNDIVFESVYIPRTQNVEDELFCAREANKAMLALSKNGGGPVHINLEYQYVFDFSANTLPDVKPIYRYTLDDKLPAIPHGRVAVMLGAHLRFDKALTETVDRFCATHDAIVICQPPTSYSGKYAFRSGLLFGQINYKGELNKIDLLIHIGETSSDCIGFQIHPKEVWRVSEDGILKDRFNCLSAIFEMSEMNFFEAYSNNESRQNSYINECLSSDLQVRKQIPELPYSNFWIAQKTAPHLPSNSDLYLSIINSIRSWDYALTDTSVLMHANTGGFGIDGCLSTMVGASLVSPHKEFYGVFGDLAFFYDMNVLGNRHIGKNLHIMIVNNDGGQQFRNFDHGASSQGVRVNDYVAAAGHYGAKSQDLVKHFAQDLGFRYLSASSKDEYLKVMPEFLRAADRSVVCEVFTDENNENEALHMLRSIIKPDITDAAKESLKGLARKFLK